MEIGDCDPDEQTKSYLWVLPNEILIKILQFLNTFDVIQFCEAYPRCECFLAEKVLLNTVNLSKKTGYKNVPSLSDLMKRFRIECITVFNITYVYWVPAAEIRKCLKHLENLEELHIIGTKVGLTTIDCKSYKSLKLKKLAVSVHNIDRDIQKPRAEYFPNVRCLCVQIVSKKDYTFQFRLESIINNLKYLEELWIYDITDSFPLNYDNLTYSTSYLKVFAFKAVCAMCATLRYRGLTKMFFNERTGREAYYEKAFKAVDPRSVADSAAWKVLNELHATPPYGLNDSKKLYRQETNINEIMFEELNFFHVMHSCCPRYLIAIREIITSRNCSNLKKLTLTNCLFADEPPESSDSTQKKKKKYDYEEYSFEEHKVLINNLKNLKELEIFVCSRMRCTDAPMLMAIRRTLVDGSHSTQPSVISSSTLRSERGRLARSGVPGFSDAKYGGFKIYYFIQHFKNLSQLSLEVPGSLNGEFLKLVLENCSFLESLKINVVVSNESFNHDFCRYIGLAKKLKNLRYEHYRISLENLFLGLSAIKTPKMERLFLKCKLVDNFGVANCTKFLQKNPSLDFVMIIIDSATAAMRKKLIDELRKFKSTPDKIFVVRQDENVYDGSFPIPQIYKYELMRHHSLVGGLNIPEDFYNS